MSFDSDLASSLRGNQELIEDLCRYSEGILTEKQVRQKWHLANNEVWTSLGADDFVERVELERTRRIRSCATKRELAQLHIVRGPDILNTIMTDPARTPSTRSTRLRLWMRSPTPAHHGLTKTSIVLSFAST